MNRKNLIAIAVAAVVVVVLIVVVPGLGNDDEPTNTTAGTTAAAAQGSAPPISPDATQPPGHPDVNGSADATSTAAPTVDVAPLEEAYKKDPKDVANLLLLGKAYLEGQRTEDAVKKFNEVLAVDAKNSEAQTALAMVDFNAGKTAEAQKQLEEIAKADPKSQAALYSLAIIYFSANNRDKAKATWEKVVAIDSTTEYGALAAQFVELMSGSGGASTGENPHAGSTPTTAAK